MPVAADTTIGVAQRRRVVDLFPPDRRHPHDDQLGNPIPALDNEWLRRIGVEERHHDLPAVAAVDKPGSIDHGHPVTGGDPAAGQHEPGKSNRQSQGEPDRDYRSATGRSEHTRLPGPEVYAGISRQRLVRWGEIPVEA